MPLLSIHADIFFTGRSVTGLVAQVSDALAVLPAHPRLSVGTRIIVRLFVAGFDAPMDLEGHVVSRTSPATDDGALVTLAWIFASERERESLASALARAAHPEEDAGQWHDDQRYRLLVVEDNAIVRESVLFGARRSLGRQGVLPIIDTARDIERAWQHIEENHYDLMLVDYDLPGGNGDMLVRRIRASEHYADLAIVAMGVSGVDAQRAFMDAGADLFFDKPIAMRDLLNTIQLFASGVMGGQAANP